MENTIVYCTIITLIELAHIITKSMGHTPEFNENMTLLVKACQEIRVLPHKIPPAFHCGEFLSFD
jgi:hypothetical protein